MSAKESGTCRHCGKPIMWTTYNGKLRWCHVPLLRVRCVDTEAKPVGDQPLPGWPCERCGSWGPLHESNACQDDADERNRAWKP